MILPEHILHKDKLLKIDAVDRKESSYIIAHALDKYTLEYEIIWLNIKEIDWSDYSVKRLGVSNQRIKNAHKSMLISDEKLNEIRELITHYEYNAGNQTGRDIKAKLYKMLDYYGIDKNKHNFVLLGSSGFQYFIYPCIMRFMSNYERTKLSKYWNSKYQDDDFTNLQKWAESLSLEEFKKITE